MCHIPSFREIVHKTFAGNCESFVRMIAAPVIDSLSVTVTWLLIGQDSQV